jgi:beta-barrel assembly-enhancing protease
MRIGPEDAVSMENKEMITGHSLRRTGVLPIMVLVAACATPLRSTQPVVPASPVAQTPAPNPPPVVIAPPVAPAMPELPLTLPPTPVNKETALRTWMEYQNRLYRVAAPLLFKNVEICSHHVRNVLGLTAKNRYSYGDEFVDAASALGLDDRLRVINVLPGSGAERAGIEQGDILLVAGIDPIPASRDAERDAAALVGAELHGRDTVHMTVSREDERITTDVPATPACAFSVELGDIDQRGNYSDGHRVLVTRGMVDAAKSDAELASVIAEEMSHSLSAQESDIAGAKVIDELHVLHVTPPLAMLPTRSVVHSQNASAEWQVLAMYLLQRAGYSIDEAAAFWQRKP